LRGKRKEERGKRKEERGKRKEEKGAFPYRVWSATSMVLW
jgi:hypothetical protein